MNSAVSAVADLAEDKFSATLRTKEEDLCGCCCCDGDDDTCTGELSVEAGDEVGIGLSSAVCAAAAKTSSLSAVMRFASEVIPVSSCTHSTNAPSTNSASVSFLYTTVLIRLVFLLSANDS